MLRVERGGEVTYHGPGQLVAYPIVRLADRGLLLRPYVRALEAALADTCAAFGVAAGRREGHPGCWVDPDGAAPRKIGALGIRVERGVAYHGIALNVNVPLADFDLIDPCGMPGLTSTSIAAELGRPDEPPSTARVAAAAAVFARSLAGHLGAGLGRRPAAGRRARAERSTLDGLIACPNRVARPRLGVAPGAARPLIRAPESTLTFGGSRSRSDFPTYRWLRWCPGLRAPVRSIPAHVPIRAVSGKYPLDTTGSTGR